MNTGRIIRELDVNTSQLRFTLKNLIDARKEGDEDAIASEIAHLDMWITRSELVLRQREP